MSKTFYEYFKENMTPLNLPAPETLFGTLTTATTTIGTMMKFIQTYGTRATVSEMILTLPGAATGAGGGIVGISVAASEMLFAVGALSAAYYIGACIGSLAVATGKKFSGGVSLVDCLSTAKQYGIDTPQWLQQTLSSNLAMLGLPSPTSPDRHTTWSA
jgi:hypothetical protein